MAEQYKYFADIGKAFADGASPQPQDVLSLLYEQYGLLFLPNRNINWYSSPRKLDNGYLQNVSDNLQDILGLEKSPIGLLQEGGSFWDASKTRDGRDDLSTALSMYHATYMESVSDSNPALYQRLKDFGSAAHWIARINGATWREAVDASRHFQLPGEAENPYSYIMDIHIKRHGTK